MKWLVDERSPDAEVVRVVLDNLNTHKPAAIYETFPPAEARRICKKLACLYTPKHGSWLNMAELELSIVQRQCLDRRLPNVATLTAELHAYETRRNAQHATIDWQFTTPSHTSHSLTVPPVYLAAGAVNTLVRTLPAGTAYLISIVLLTMFTGQLVHHQGNVARDTLFDRALNWGLECLPVEPVHWGQERRTVHAIDSSTVARLRANPKRCALLGKGYCQRAGHANLVAALTTVVLMRGGRVGAVRRTRFGAPCAEAITQLFAALPESGEKRLFSGDAGSATIKQFRAATEREALVGRLRKNVAVRRAPHTRRPGQRGRSPLHTLSSISFYGGSNYRRN